MSGLVQGDATHRTPARIDLVLLFLFLLASWAPFLFFGTVLYSGDTFYYFYPYRFTLFAGLQGGYLPTWEAGALSGNPFCASPQANCFYPLSLWYLLPDFFTAYHLALVSHLAFLGGGTWLWVRGHGHGRVPALLAALCAVSSGFTLSMVNRLDKLESLAWWPWAMWGLERAWHRRRGGFAVLAVALSLSLLAGGLEIWGMMGVCLGVWCLFVPGQAEGETRVARSLRPLAILTAAVGVCLLITAPQWLSLRQLLSLSTRAAGMRYEKAVELSLHPPDLLGIAFPHLFFDPGTFSYHPVAGGASESRYFSGLYLGWMPLLAVLSTLSLLTRGDSAGRTARAAWLLVAAGLFMALGQFNPVYRLLFQLLPPLHAIRFPEKFLSLVGFALLPLVALGVEQWMNRSRGFAVAAVVGGVLSVAWLAIPGVLHLAGGALLAGLCGGDRGAWADRLYQLAGEHRTHALLLLAAGLAGVGRLRGLVRPGVALPALAGIVGLDLWLGTAALNPPMNAQTLRTPPAFARVLEGRRPGARIHVLPLYESGPLAFPEGLSHSGAYAWLWQMLYPNTGQLSGLQYADGSRAIRPDHPNRFFAALRGLPVEQQLELAAVAGIDAVVGRADGADPALQAPKDLELLARDDRTGLALWLLSTSVPRAYVVPRAVYFASNGAVMEAMLAGSYAPRSAVGLVGEPEAAGADGQGSAGPAGALPTDGVAGVFPAGAENGAENSAAATLARVPVATALQVLEGGRRKIADPVDAGTGGYLVLPEAWYPGWTARVDGNPVPVLEANGYQQAIKLPPGRHRVDLEFLPEGQGGGVLMCLLGLVGMLAGLVVRRG